MVNAEIASSTLNNPAIDQCVRKQALTMRFPRPRGGGIVVVTYPYVFNAAP